MSEFDVPQLKRHVIDEDYRGALNELRRGVALYDKLSVEMRESQSLGDERDVLAKIINETMYNNRNDIRDLKEFYFSPDIVSLITKDGNKPVGISQFRSLDDCNATYFVLSTFYPEYRGKGNYKLNIGLRTLNALSNCHKYIGTRSSNPVSIKALLSSGFQAPFNSSDLAYEETLSISKTIIRSYLQREVEINENMVLKGNQIEDFLRAPNIEKCGNDEIDSFVHKRMDIERGDRLVLVKAIDELLEKERIVTILSSLEKT